MLTESEFKRYVIFEHKLSKQAREYVEMVRGNEPSRMAGAHAKNNLSSWATSNIMGKTISLESGSAENAFHVLCEFSNSHKVDEIKGRVLERYDQPDPVNIIKTNKNGVKRKRSYTGDNLILTTSGVEMVEVKTKDEVDKNIELYPDDWKREKNEEVRFIPAEKKFNEMGIKFRVFEYTHDLRYLIHNMTLMLESQNEIIYTEELLTKVVKKLKKSFALTLSELKNDLELDCYTPLIQMIDKGVLIADIKGGLLSLGDSCLVASSDDLLEEAKKISDKYKVYRDGILEKTSVKKFPSEKLAKTALYRLKCIERGDKNRSVYRWREKVREGRSQSLNDFQSLVPLYYLSGNSKRKICKIVDDYLTEYLMSVHALNRGMSVYRSYIKYKVNASELHPNYDPVSRRTFTKHLNQIPPDVIEFVRTGKRGANAVADPTDPEKRNLKAQVAWEKAAVDHYLADIYLIFYSTDGNVYVQRPWVTAIVDLYSSVVLAVSISFLSPSRRSVAKVMRECVRRHGKLPLEIIVDRGSDFRSVYFASFLAHYSIKYTLRPASYPQYGGEVEGLFGEFLKQWLSQREGNLANHKEVRAVDGNKSPKKFAILKPEDLYREINAFCMWRDNKSRGHHDKSARERFNLSQDEYPFIPKVIDYDSDFLLVTAVETKKYTVNFQKGIHIRQLWYYTPNIAKVRGKKTKLEVRIDPENPHVIYAFIENEWCPCFSSESNSYSAKSSVMQLVEGLTKYEASQLKLNIKEQDDFGLVKIIREMNKMIGLDDVLPVAEIECESVDCEDKPIFDELKYADVKAYKRESWG